MGGRVLTQVVELPVAASFDAATCAGAEGGSQTVTVTLGDSFETQTVTLPVTVIANGGATDADYSGIPENLVFAPGETTKSFSARVVDDAEDDDGKSITLTDNDDPDVDVEFGAATYTVADGSRQSISVNLNADPVRMVIIPIITANQGGAAAGDDYPGVLASVTFHTGETSKSFTSAATEDQSADSGESVLLGFGTVPDARVSEATPAGTTVNIRQTSDMFALECTTSVWCADLELVDWGSTDWGWFRMMWTSLRTPSSPSRAWITPCAPSRCTGTHTPSWPTPGAGNSRMGPPSDLLSTPVVEATVRRQSTSRTGYCASTESSCRSAPPLRKVAEPSYGQTPISRRCRTTGRLRRSTRSVLKRWPPASCRTRAGPEHPGW